MATSSGPTHPKGRIVLVLSLLLCGAFGLWGIVQPDVMTGSALAVANYSLDSLGWLFLDPAPCSWP